MAIEPFVNHMRRGNVLVKARPTENSPCPPASRFSSFKYIDQFNPLLSYVNGNTLNKSNAKILYGTANSCSYDEFSVIFIYNFIDVNIVITIEIEQVIIDNNS